MFTFFFNSNGSFIKYQSATQEEDHLIQMRIREFEVQG